MYSNSMNFQKKDLSRSTYMNWTDKKDFVEFVKPHTNVKNEKIFKNIQD